MYKYFFIIIFFIFHQPGHAQYIFGNGKSKVIIVRHAEKQTGNDPALTPEGDKRAGDLMRALNESIKRVYVTQYKRTQNTADSLRIQLGIDTVHYLVDTSCMGLFSAIQKNNDWDKPILIVSHSNIIPKIIYKMGVSNFPQQDIADIEFDNLFVITYQKNKARLIQLKYGNSSNIPVQKNNYNNTPFKKK